MGRVIYFCALFLAAFLMTASPLFSGRQTAAPQLSNKTSGEIKVVHFTAEVTRVWDPWGWIDTVKVGDLMYGTYVYETGAPDQDPSPREGRYSNPHATGVYVYKYSQPCIPVEP